VALVLIKTPFFGRKLAKIAENLIITSTLKTNISPQNFVRRISAGEKDYANSCKVALALLAEFKSLGILPSLAAYKEVSEIFITATKRSMILFEIIEELVRNVGFLFPFLNQGHGLNVSVLLSGK
jgi:hypothetical protein